MKPLNLIALAAFALSPLLAMNLRPGQYEGGYRADEAEQERRNTSAFATILGGFRTNLSDLMFVKTELYLDSGVGYQPHINLSALASTGSVDAAPMAGPSAPAHDPHTCDDPSHHHEVPPASDEHSFGFESRLARGVVHNDHDDHEGHDHDADTCTDPSHNHGSEAPPDTLIRTQHTDFRGFIGDLHRQVKPWRDPSAPHQHTTGSELLPWYRLMTLSDPHNVRAYMIGAWWLKNEHAAPQQEEAIRFLDEGIANNPRAFQLQLMKGYVLRELGRHELARDAFVAAADLVIKVRPAAGTESPNWSDYQEDDARASLRMAVFLTRDIDGAQPALTLARRYLDYIGTDGPLETQIETLSHAGE